MITNSIDVIQILKNFTGITSYLVGGVLTESYDLTGKLAIDGIRQFNADYSFISCSGITPAQGIMGNDLHRLPIQQEILHNSDTRIVLCDTSKAGKKSLLAVAPLSDISYVVMEKHPGCPDLADALGDRLIIADRQTKNSSGH